MILKVCGMRDADNIRDVEQCGCHWMGFICWPRSSRCVSVAPSYLPRCTRVGVFVDADDAYIDQMVDMLDLNRIQLHGSESPGRCKEIATRTHLPLTKAISVLCESDVAKAEEYVGIADYILFDTKCKCVGGSGVQFDWDILQHYHGPIPFILAGGIGPGDEARLQQFHHPYFAGIDLNSRFEQSPAFKNVSQVETFIKNLQEIIFR